MHRTRMTHYMHTKELFRESPCANMAAVYRITYTRSRNIFPGADKKGAGQG